MKVIKVKTDNKCEMPICNNTADYAICADSFRGKSVNVCSRCLKSLYREIGKVVTPKGLVNVIERANKRREEI